MSSSSSSRRAWIWPALIGLAILLAYSNGLPNGFIFDDVSHLRTIWQLDASELPAHVMHSSRAMADLSFWVNTQVMGRSPGGYRAVNLLIHWVNAMLLFALVRQTLASIQACAIAGVTALWWGLHPLNTMAVTYVIQRHESLMALFFLLTLYCVMRTERGRLPVLWGVAAILACALGMVTKQVMVAAPVVAWLCDRCFWGQSTLRVLRRRGWVYVGLMLTWLLLWRSLTGTGESAGFGVTSISPGSYLLSQGQVILHYLRLSVWPSPLIFDYTWSAAYPDGAWLFPAALVALMVLVALVGVARNRWWGALGASFFCILAPTSSVLPIIDLANEYRMYLPVMAIMIAMVLGVFWMFSQKRVVIWGLAGCAAFLFMGLTVRRNLDYRDARTMWTLVTQQVPGNPRAWNNLAVGYVNEGAYDVAQPMLEKALAINPSYSTPHFQQGRIAERQGDDAGALAHYRRAHELEPTRATYAAGYGRLLAKIGRFDDARKLFEQAIAQQPTQRPLLAGWARVQHEAGHRRQAIATATQALQLDPGHAPTLVLLADVVDDPKQALALYRQALELGYVHGDVHIGIGRVRLEQGDVAGAHQAFETAMHLDPHDVTTLRLYGQTAIQVGEVGLGVAALERCVELKRDQPELWNQLGALYARKGDLEKAVVLFATAAKLDPTYADAIANLKRARMLLDQR